MHARFAIALLAVTAGASQAQVTFDARTDQPLPNSTPFPDAALGDADGDGDVDVITSSEPSWFLENQGDGTFAAPVMVATFDAEDVALADVNNDGILDMVRAEDNSTYSFLGQGDGTFASAAPVSLNAFTPIEDVEVADFTGDGNVDYLLLGSSIFTGKGWIWLRVGDGLGGADSTTIQVLPTTNATYPRRAAVGNVDDAGLIDFAVTIETPDTSSVTVYRNGGAGAFKVSANLGIGQRITDLRLVDINNDRVDDLLITGDFGFVTFENNGDGTFQPFKLWSSAVAMGRMAVADFDADGTLDVGYGQNVVLDGSVAGSHFSVLRGTPDGSFEQAFTRTGFATMVEHAVADFDGDSRVDVGFVSLNDIGNSSYTVLPNVTYGPDAAWLEAGQGLASDEGDGVADKPFMIARGSLVAETPFSLSIERNLAPQDTAFLVIGASEAGAPFQGGTLVPAPNFVVGPLPPIVESDGTLVIGATTPAGAPAGAMSWVQAWFIPGAGQSTFSATNAIVATAP